MMKILFGQKIGCCSIYARLSIPELGIDVWFNDDCQLHAPADFKDISLAEVQPAEAEHWMLIVDNSAIKAQWFLDGVVSSQEEVLNKWLQL